MVIVPRDSAPGWSGLSEENIKTWIKQRLDSEPGGVMDIVGVFGIPCVGILLPS